MSFESDGSVADRHLILRGIYELCNCCTLFGNCDCLSSTFLGISVSFFFFGTVMMFNGESDDFLTKFELRPACVIGFIFICTGLIMAMKSLLYLRSKSLIIMLGNSQAVPMNLRVPSADSVRPRTCSLPEDNPSPEYVVRNASAATLPPAYDETLPASELGESTLSFAPIDTPPPSYDEAVYLMSVKANKEGEMEKSESAEAVNKP